MLTWRSHPLNGHVDIFRDAVVSRSGDCTYVVTRNEGDERWISSYQNQRTGGSASATMIYHDTTEAAKRRCEDHAAGTES